MSFANWWETASQDERDAFMRRISFTGALSFARIEPWSGSYYTLVLNVPDVDHPTGAQIAANFLILPPVVASCTTEHDFLRHVQRTAAAALAHELAEQFTFDGRRVFNPHQHCRHGKSKQLRCHECEGRTQEETAALERKADDFCRLVAQRIAKAE